MTITIDQPLIAERLAALQQQRAARKDPDDLMLPPREMRAYIDGTAKIDGAIAALNTAAATLAEVPSLEPNVKWRDQLTEWRALICAERLAVKSPIRDRETKAHVEDLEFCIKLIDRGLGAARLPVVTLEPTRIGQLMQAAGYAVSGPALRGPNGWQGSLPEVEQRIKTLTRQRAAAEAALDAVLLTDAERTAQDAEHQVYREALNQMTLRVGPDGMSLVVYDEDDAVIDPAAMTEIQRKALAWFDAAQRRATS